MRAISPLGAYAPACVRARRSRDCQPLRSSGSCVSERACTVVGEVRGVALGHGQRRQALALPARSLAHWTCTEGNDLGERGCPGCGRFWVRKQASHANAAAAARAQAQLWSLRHAAAADAPNGAPLAAASKRPIKKERLTDLLEHPE